MLGKRERRKYALSLEPVKARAGDIVLDCSMEGGSCGAVSSYVFATAQERILYYSPKAKSVSSGSSAYPVSTIDCSRLTDIREHRLHAAAQHEHDPVRSFTASDHGPGRGVWTIKHTY